MFKVYGLTVDDQTRCQHYHSVLDIIAIKFKCCNKFYPCYQCHQACETHDIERWQATEFYKHAILCGNCRQTLTIRQYMQVTHCPYCQAQFNSGCQKHYSIYFEVE
ncbi:CHY zinc finger protein [Actinobacillus pleuropneumoniae]|uniref:CHY zinc finger protein n=1 Tax=Actinobacillus pleuropneumoniae TaxID=715 RepID=UPI003D0189B5